MPLVTPNAPCDKVAHKSILPRKAHSEGRLGGMKFKNEVEIKSVHYFTKQCLFSKFSTFLRSFSRLVSHMPDTGLRQANKARAQRPAEDTGPCYLLLSEVKCCPDQRQDRLCPWLAASITRTREDSDHKEISGRWIMESQVTGEGFCAVWEYRWTQSPLAINLTPNVPGLVPLLFMMVGTQRQQRYKLCLFALGLSSLAGFSVALVFHVSVCQTHLAPGLC